MPKRAAADRQARAEPKGERLVGRALPIQGRSLTIQASEGHGS